MSGSGAAQPPPAMPSMRIALLLLLALVVVPVVWLAFSYSTRGPGPGSAAAGTAPSGTPPRSAPSGSAPPVSCSPPPSPPPTTALPHFDAAPDPSTAAGSHWKVTLRTTCGVVGLSLDGAAAPATVASFVRLASSGYWTDSVCHRLTTREAPTGFLQCGDPTGRNDGDPGYDLPLENPPPGDHYVRGTLGMARGDDTASTAGEFFMVHRDFTVPAGDPVYTVFGTVVEGQAIIDHIAAHGGEDTRPDGPPFTSISILTVSVTRA